MQISVLHTYNITQCQAELYKAIDRSASKTATLTSLTVSWNKNACNMQIQQSKGANF